MSTNSTAAPRSSSAAVLLVDIQQETLEATAAELRALGRVERLVTDLRDPDSAPRIESGWL
ncbi:hypothetical protein JHV675_52630 [Mycobacterium avium subsp. hominissuis]